MSCSTTTMAQPRSACTRRSSGASASASALGDTGRGLVEQDDVGRLGQHAGQLDDAAGAGGQRPGQVVAVAVEPGGGEELVDPVGHGVVDVEGGRQAQRGGHRVAVGQVAVEGDRHGVGHGQARVEAGVLEGTAQSGQRPL